MALPSALFLDGYDMAAVGFLIGNYLMGFQGSTERHAADRIVAK
jgi:hypothetical protein